MNFTNKSAKNLIFKVKNVANYTLFGGKFLNLGNSAGVKDLTNIMSGGKWVSEHEVFCPKAYLAIPPTKALQVHCILVILGKVWEFCIYCGTSSCTQRRKKRVKDC